MPTTTQHDLNIELDTDLPMEVIVNNGSYVSRFEGTLTTGGEQLSESEFADEEEVQIDGYLFLTTSDDCIAFDYKFDSFDYAIADKNHLISITKIFEIEK